MRIHLKFLSDLPKATAVEPIGSAQDALALFLSVLETPRDPFDVERAVDGLSRFGSDLRENETALSPLKKRAKQLWQKHGDVDVRAVLALTGRALCEGKSIAELRQDERGDGFHQPITEKTLQNQHLVRNAEMIDRIFAGTSLPLLSLPSDSSGMIAPEDLATRLDAYRSADVIPGIADLSFALMRLGEKGRGRVGDLPQASEAGRAFAYAVGHDVEVGPTPELWAAAWRARRPLEADHRVASLFGTSLPDCGVPADIKLDVRRVESRGGEYFWIKLDVPMTPELTDESVHLPAISGTLPQRRYYPMPHCGCSFADVAWASLHQPSRPDNFFRQGLLHQDEWQKLTDNHTRAYLEPFFRPGPDVNPLAAGVLAYYLAVEDKSVTSLAAEASATLLSNGRMSQAVFANAVKAFMISGALPTARWTKGFAIMSEAGASGSVRDVIGLILDFPPEQCPRDLGGMLELYFELNVATGCRPLRPETLACLKSIPGGGKVAKFSKKLLSLTQEAA